MTAAVRLAVVGIGEDGWAGLGAAARAHLAAARLVLGAARQLALLPDDAVSAERAPWPSPMLPRVEALAAQVRAGDRAAGATVVLASGDPMLHGVGATLARLVGPERLEVLPAPSAYSLACARLGWAQHEVPLVSLVADAARDPLPTLLAAGRAIVYVPGAGGARALAAQLRDAGLGHARLTILARLGGPAEHRLDTTAQAFDALADPLHLVAVDLAPGHAAASAEHPRARRLRSTVPGLPDDAYAGDGQLTRADVRAVVLAALAPAAGERLWDVGAGSGTIAVEWCRAAPGATAHAIERRADRCATVAENARALGAGAAVTVVEGPVPAALDALPAPDAIFVGGAASHPGLLDRCWTTLPAGGRLAATGVTLEGERALIDAHARHGGRLVRLEHAHVDRLGRFTAWRPERPIVLWAAARPATAADHEEPHAR